MIIPRNKTFHLRRRVPTRYANIEPRKIIFASLHTDSETVAKSKAPAVWTHLVEAWESKLAGDTEDAERRYAAALELANKRGFRYLPAFQIARLPLAELVERIEAVPVHKGRPDKIEAAAVLGGASPPEITVSRALQLFWALAADRALGKTEDQLRRWKNPREKAVRNFIEVVGDKALRDISPDDALDFRGWWVERIKKEGLTPNSANKDLTFVRDTLETINRMKRLGLELPLTGLSIKEGEKAIRPPFSTEWIKTKLLAPGALDGLNKEARCILLVLINTGARPSEIAGLLPEHIRLDHKAPHIAILPEGRQLKTSASKREIPLLGVSLEAMKQCPNGFPTYFGRDLVSATVNKFLKENGLLQTPKHSLYGLRHSFEDRMLAAGIDERIRCDIFGHGLKRERYGAGASLEDKAKLLQAVAL